MTTPNDGDRFNPTPTCEGCGVLIKAEQLVGSLGEGALQASVMDGEYQIRVVCPNSNFHLENPESKSGALLYPVKYVPHTQLGMVVRTLLSELGGATKSRRLTAGGKYLMSDVTD